ncbi:MAG: hypothetical protein LBR77_04675 [Lachnospiraceae bacterium]|nr:hypothetical protein [Lachnospiraceae bacterium]
MQNFNILDKHTIQLPTGVFAGVESFACYDDGRIQGVKLSERNMLLTHAGELVPAFTQTPRRKDKFSVEFYRDGMVKAVALEEMQEVITPIGEMPAELVTFFETGELRRVFPLDGKISGFWTEADERALNIPLSFELGFAAFRANISCLCFYQSGELESVTLYPGEEIEVAVPVHGYGKAMYRDMRSAGVGSSANTGAKRVHEVPDGAGAHMHSTVAGKLGVAGGYDAATMGIPVRQGFSLYESGALKSVEPARPVRVPTPIGALWAYDPDAIGICADDNSLCFAKNGALEKLTTAGSRVTIQTGDGHFAIQEPHTYVNPLDGESMAVAGMTVRFGYGDGGGGLGVDGGGRVVDGKVRGGGGEGRVVGGEGRVVDGEGRVGGAAGCVWVEFSPDRERYLLSDCHFRVGDFVVPGADGADGEGFGGCSPAKCAGCSLCG